MTAPEADPNPLSGYGLAPTPGGGWVPVPDPTKMTTDQLRRELATLRELVEAQIQTQSAAVEARLDAMDEANALRLDAMGEVPATIREQIAHLKELIETRLADAENLSVTRLAGIEQRFAERDIRFDQQNGANAAALNAALASAKELGALQTQANAAANAKTEQSVSQQLAALAEKIDVTTRRLDRGEGSDTGAATSRTERRLDLGQLIAVVAVILAAISIAAFLLKK